MEFRLLGPLEAVDGGRAVELPRRKHRALLAALLLHAGEPVSRDRLIEDLWGESPPRTARDALQNYVSLLRKALGADVLVTRGGGYLLDVSPEQIDAARFEQLTAEARTTESADGRAEKLRKALGLWRGPALADLAYEPFAAVEISRLEELRLAATQDLIDAELELGRHADLVPELETLIQEHPFDERLRGQLMLALYRGGRQAEALEAYQAARRVLDEELGLEPGPPLRELEQAILRHDPALAAPAAALPAAMPSRRTVTVLFADLVDSSSLVEGLDPEAAHALLGRYFATARAAVEGHGGVVEKFIGDAVMAVFGAPVAHEDDALRAVRAAVEIRERAPAADERLVVRIGVNTGEVLAGAGDEVLVTGAAVTVAKRLEQAARGGEVLIGAATQRLVRDAVRSRPTKRRDPVAFRVDEVTEGAPGLARRFDTPLVGREQELAALRGAFEAARDESRCAVFTVVGDAGIGKTRLARELLAEVGEEATVLVGRCVAYGEGATFLPLTEMIGRDVLDAGSTGEIFLAARRRFGELAAERPLLLVFEDVHWAEPTLLDFVDYLGAQATGSPILALCLARPDLLAERPGWDGSLVLEPLTDDQARELAGDEPHADRIAEIAEGNPLYVEQLLAYVGEEGAAALETVPGSIEALLASRLDRLGPEERAVAQRAAVIGRRFSPASVAALGPVDGLAGLEQAGFVHRAPDMYRFHHVLVRDVAYAGTPKAERAELHQRHADWLDGQPDGSDELVGYHLEQAAGYLGELGAPEQQVTRIATNAGRRLGAAGIAAWKRGDARATVNLLGRATALLHNHDPERLELMCELGIAHRTAGELSLAEAVLEQALGGASAAGDQRAELRAKLELANVRLFIDPEGGSDRLLDVAAEAIPTLETLGDDRSLGRTWLLVSFVRGSMHCRFESASNAAEQALTHYRRCGWPVTSCLTELAYALFTGPTPVSDAIVRGEELLSQADLSGRATVFAYLGGLEAMRNCFDKGRELLEQARSIFVEMGRAALIPIVLDSVAGEVELLAGNTESAEDILTGSCEALEIMGDHAYLATRAADLAEACYLQGRFQEATSWSRTSERHAASDDTLTQVSWRAVRGKALARTGDLTEGKTLAVEAVRLAEQTDALNHRGRLLLDLAEVLHLSGDSREANEAASKGLRLVRQKGNLALAQQAQSLLAELTPAQ